MSMSIGAAAPHGFAHGHSHAQGVGRQESPAWQARAADPQAKGAAFGALVSQFARGLADGSAPPSGTDAVGTTDQSSGVTPPPTGGSPDPSAAAGSTDSTTGTGDPTTTAGSTTPPPADPIATASGGTDPSSGAAPGSTLDIQV